MKAGEIEIWVRVILKTKTDRSKKNVHTNNTIISNKIINIYNN